MKKLLLGTISALAFLLGFASCSDDVHDIGSVETLYIGGGFRPTTVSVDSTYKWVNSSDKVKGDFPGAWEIPVENGTFSFEFTYDSSNENWGDDVSIGALVTSFDVSKSSGWDDDINKFRWMSDGIEPNTDASELKQGASNVLFKGLSIGGSYKIEGTIEGSKLTAKLVQKYDTITFYVFADEGTTSFPSDKEYAMQPAGSKSYSYQFIALADEEFSFKIYNEIVGFSEVSDTMSVKQDMGYKIEYTIGGKPTLTQLSMLVDAEVISNIGHDYDFYKETNLSSSSVILLPKRSDFQFYINRTAGDSSLGWGNGESISFSSDFSSVTLNYTKRSGEPKPITVKGLASGKVYMLTFAETKDDINVKLEKIIEASALPTTIAGSWWNPNDLNLDWKIEGENATATVEAKLTDDYGDSWNKGANSTVSFVLLRTPNDWDDNTVWKNVNFNFGITTKLKREAGGNNIITNTTGSLAGKTIKLVFTGKFDEAKGEVSEISCTATIVE